MKIYFEGPLYSCKYNNYIFDISIFNTKNNLKILEELKDLAEFYGGKQQIQSDNSITTWFKTFEQVILFRKTVEFEYEISKS